MRGAWIIACALAVAGCHDGVIFEVRAHPSVPTKEVELFLGLEHCETCDAIQPVDATGPLDGEVYFRDGDPGFTARVDGDGSAWFRIQASEVGLFLKTVAAVSSDQNAAAIAFNLDLATRDHWVMELQPASSPLNVQSEDGEFVQVWRETAEPKASCIAFESWDQRQLSKRTFIVPKNDPDCDDFTPGNGECDPFVWGGSIPPTLDEMSCLVNDTTDPALPFCALGGSVCHDGQAKGACEASNYCVPSRLCAQCNAADTTTMRQCFATEVDTFQLTPRVACQLPVQLGASTGELIPCPGSTMFTFRGFEGKLAQCDALELAGRPTVANGIGPFTHEVTLTTGNVGSTTRAAKLKVLNREAGCSFDMEWSGEVTDNSMGAVAASISLMSVTPTAPAGSASKHLVMPLFVTFVKGCTNEPLCTVYSDAADDIFNCATGTVPQPATFTFGERAIATNKGVTNDTFIDSLDQSVPHGASTILELQSGGREAVSLVRFDLTAIPPGTSVMSATLYLATASAATNSPVAVHRMNEAWAPSATWLGPVALQPWQGPGASPPSRSLNPVTMFTAVSSGDNAINVPIAMIEQWIDEPQVANFGLALVTTNTTQIAVVSAESPQLNFRPMLSVTLAP